MLRLQSDERLVELIRDHHDSAFEVLFDRYQARLLGFCRHMLPSDQDAEDILQDVFVSAHRAMIADERELNVRPWLYRIARNRCLNHLRRRTADGQDSMDEHVYNHGASTAQQVQDREDLRELLREVKTLPETQRTALLLREVDSLSYTEIAQSMDTTVPAVKSLLVRARVTLAEATQARQLTCGEVRLQLAEAAEGLRKVDGPVRHHVRRCEECGDFRNQLQSNSKALAALFPIGPLAAAKAFLLGKLGIGGGSGGGAATSATATSGAAAGGGGVATAGGAAAGGGAISSALGSVGGAGGLGGVVTGAIGAKAAAVGATAALLTAGAVEVNHYVSPSREAASIERTADAAGAGATSPANQVRVAEANQHALTAAPPRDLAPVSDHQAAAASDPSAQADQAAAPADDPATEPVSDDPAAIGADTPADAVAGETDPTKIVVPGTAAPHPVSPAPPSASGSGDPGVSVGTPPVAPGAGTVTSTPPTNGSSADPSDPVSYSPPSSTPPASDPGDAPDPADPAAP